MNHYRIITGVAGTAAVLSMSGCETAKEWLPNRNEPKLVVPDFGTAKEQYEFAARYRSFTMPSGDKAKRRDQISRLKQVYGAVTSRFPQDATYTPVARLDIADLVLESGDKPAAKAEYEAIVRDYPTFPYAQARAMFRLARELDADKRGAEAKEMYRTIIDKFGKTPGRGIADIVNQSTKLYYLVREDKSTAASGS